MSTSGSQLLSIARPIRTGFCHLQRLWMSMLCPYSIWNPRTLTRLPWASPLGLMSIFGMILMVITTLCCLQIHAGLLDVRRKGAFDIKSRRRGKKLCDVRVAGKKTTTGGHARSLWSIKGALRAPDAIRSLFVQDIAVFSVFFQHFYWYVRSGYFSNYEIVTGYFGNFPK